MTGDVNSKKSLFFLNEDAFRKPLPRKTRTLNMTCCLLKQNSVFFTKKKHCKKHPCFLQCFFFVSYGPGFDQKNIHVFLVEKAKQKILFENSKKFL